jgi:TonB-linked SusC/RagA family outer membrane protein
MTKFKLLLLVMLLSGKIMLFAQERTITGKITDETSGAPVAGATVSFKGLKKGVSTDANGVFAIKGPAGPVTLIITSIGFATKEMLANPSSGSLNITLGSDSKQLGEVVVTALGITRQSKTLVYATQTVPVTQLTEVRATDNFLGSLSGKVANLVVTQGSGGLGSGAQIILRGNRSIQGAASTALIVVDGVPIQNNTYSAAGNDFGSVQSSDGASSINPDDIESLTVLRGASAAALYGSQAGNGVLVITTKKGKKNRMDVTVNSGFQVEKPFALPQFQNVYGQGNEGLIATDSSQSGASWGAKMQGQSYINYLYKPDTYTAQPNNVKDFYKTGMSLNNYVGFSAGSDKVQNYFSYTNTYGKGIIRNNDMNRHNLNYRITAQISPKLSIDAKVTYIAQNINGRPRTGEENSPVFDAYEMPRSEKTSNAKMYQAPNASAVEMPTNWPSTLNSIYQNPYWMLNNTSISEVRQRVIGFAALKYQIVPWLSIRGSANLDRTADEIQEKYQQGTLLWNTNAGGTYQVTDLNWTNKWFDLILEGSNKITNDLKIGYHAGTIYQDDIYNQALAGSNGLNVANKFSLSFASNPTISQKGTEVVTQSVFGQANLSWKDAIFLDASVRNDWDSRLPSPYTYLYPSVGLSAVLTDLIKTIPPAISFLKLSANYAQVGNGGQFGVTNPSLTFDQGAGNGSIARSLVYPIPNLKPELVKSYEFGVEAKFAHDRVGFAATYYKSNSTNQLIEIPVPVATGYSLQYINAGNIENHGWEFVISATPIKTRDFTWDVAINLSLNRNKVLSLAPGITTTNLGGADNRSAQPQVNVGGSFGDLYSYQWLKNTKGQYEVQAAGSSNPGAPLTSYITGGALGYIGNYNPREVVGMTNTFHYKRFDLRFLIDGRIGGILVSGTEMNLAFSGITKGTLPFRGGGLSLGGYDASGNAVSTPITAQQFWQTASGQRYGVGQFFAYDATSLRLRELSIGYDIPWHSAVIKSMRISAVARNLFWIYRGSSILSIPGMGKRKMWMDPDMSNGNSFFQGTEYGALPSTRSLGANLKVNF